MGVLQNKIDFTLLISVTHANPNGDPLAGNRPRESWDGYGEISDVCIKRKIRNRLQDMGERIFVQSADRCDDGCISLKARAEANTALTAVAKGKNTNSSEYAEIACKEWIDVRSFGQLFAFKGGSKESSGVSVGIKGPVTINTGVSIDPINNLSMQITKSVNGAETKDGKASDTMGMKHYVDFGVYVVHGSINCQLAEKTGFTEEDAAKIKQALLTLFENDESSARPAGSMEVCGLYWWAHSGKTSKWTPAQVHRAVTVEKKQGIDRPRSVKDYIVSVAELDGVSCEKYESLI